ncbi:uncharacterized protein LOC118755537 [Rhagoletis pomonella]|uniref:uncharacterized protein LOC118755537 n=1 Tax=Rhagoletis pomonella TaxID=28610 RepID=UPI0017836E7B|nr:uncharacterized protein LOC118755537 [Rhagoletis pomonella]
MADGKVMSPASIGHAAADYFSVAPATAAITTVAPTSAIIAPSGMATNASVGGVIQTNSGVAVSTVGGASAMSIIGSGSMSGSNINLNVASMAASTAMTAAAAVTGTTAGAASAASGIGDNQGYHQLSVTIEEASLRNNGFLKPNPYVELVIDNKSKRKTDVVKNTYLPKWNEKFTVLVMLMNTIYKSKYKMRLTHALERIHTRMHGSCAQSCPLV